MIPDYRTTTWQGRPCSICKVCGQTSGSMPSDRLADLWRREHTPRCGRGAPTATVSGPCGDAGPEPAHRPTRTENGAQSAAQPTTKEKP